MPRQMPRIGTPDPTAPSSDRRHGSVIDRVAAKWPTPGMMIPAGVPISSGVAGVTHSAPTARSALRTDVRLPAP